MKTYSKNSIVVNPPIINASPLIYLSRSNYLPLLQLFGPEILVPQAVAQEIQHRDTQDPTVTALATTPWLRIVTPPEPDPLIQATVISSSSRSKICAAISSAPAHNPHHKNQPPPLPKPPANSAPKSKPKTATLKKKTAARTSAIVPPFLSRLRNLTPNRQPFWLTPSPINNGTPICLALICLALKVVNMNYVKRCLGSHTTGNTRKGRLLFGFRP